MQNIFLRYEDQIAKKCENNTWIDLICNHHVPLPLNKKHNIEALMFRITMDGVDPNKTFVVNIFWDDGTETILAEKKMDLFNGKSSDEGARRAGSDFESSDKEKAPTKSSNRYEFLLLIDDYYPEENKAIMRLRDQRMNVIEKNEVLTSRIQVAHFWMGELIAGVFNLMETEKRFQSVRLEKQKILTQNEMAMDLEQADEILDVMNLADDMNDTEKLILYHGIEEAALENDTKTLKEHIFNVDNGSLNQLKVANKLKAIRDDIITAVKSIAYEKIGSHDIILVSSNGYEIINTMAGLFFQISQDCEFYAKEVDSELGYRIRSVIQVIFRELHSRGSHR
jgi:hypothetical protein